MTVTRSFFKKGKLKKARLRSARPRRDYCKPVPAWVRARQARMCLLRSKLRDAERSLHRAAKRYVTAEKALRKAEKAR